MKEEAFLNSTRTLGPILEERAFSEDEKVVLLHFFTNIDKNVYAAKDALPNALWALLEGGYSRSHLSMRMRFLAIFEEMKAEEEQGKIDSNELVTIQDFARSIKEGKGLNLSFFLEKAEKFMRKWAVQYGHDSLKDSDVVRFAIENVTQCAVNPIELARLGAYQEKSTRYVPFSRESLVVPTDLKQYESEVRKWNDEMMSGYETSKPIVESFLKKRIPESDFTSPAAYTRTINAKTFDIIRYFLPSTLLTSLGVVWPTREAERHISFLLSDSREEVRSIGKALYEEGMKVSPGLLSHVAETEYQQKRIKRMQRKAALQSISKKERTSGRGSDAVKLISSTPNMEENIAATILFRASNSNSSFNAFLEACKNDQNLTTEIIEDYFSERGKFDSWPIETEVGNLLFEVVIDYGAYRDLKRHRRNLFLVGPLNAISGHEYPEFVQSEPELQEVKELLDFCAKKTQELYTRVEAKSQDSAEYIILFANKQRMIWQMDPRQLAYVAELRTTPAGHQSYRTACQLMFKEFAKVAPTLAKYIRVDLTGGEEGRKKQEEKTVEKLAKLGADTFKVS